MGRGLSDLQKTILQLAYENHVSEGRNIPRYQVMVEVEPPIPLEPVDPIAALQDYNSEAYWTKYQELQDRALGAAEQRLEDILSEAARWFYRGPGASHQTLTKTWGLTITTLDDKAEADTLTHQLIERGESALTSALLDGYAALFTHEVLIAAFGFGEHRKTTISGRPAPLRGYEDNRRLPYGKFFDRSAIGEERYNTAVVSVSRAFARLEERGLVIRIYGGHQWMGIDFTPEGLVLAAYLSVNTHDNVTTLSQ